MASKRKLAPPPAPPSPAARPTRKLAPPPPPPRARGNPAVPSPPAGGSAIGELLADSLPDPSDTAVTQPVMPFPGALPTAAASSLGATELATPSGSATAVSATPSAFGALPLGTPPAAPAEATPPSSRIPASRGGPPGYVGATGPMKQPAERPSQTPARKRVSRKKWMLVAAPSVLWVAYCMLISLDLSGTAVTDSNARMLLLLVGLGLSSGVATVAMRLAAADFGVVQPLVLSPLLAFGLLHSATDWFEQRESRALQAALDQEAITAQAAKEAHEEAERLWKAQPAPKKLTPSDVARAVNANKFRMLACYTTALRKRPRLGGNIEIRFFIAADGHPRDIQITKNTMGSDVMNACYVFAFYRVTFPLPGANGQPATYSMNFDPAAMNLERSLVPNSTR